MKKSILLLLSTCFIVQVAVANPETTKAAKEAPKTDATIKAEVLSVFFSPPAGAAKGLIRYLDGAKKSIQVMAYSFTYVEIAEALARAAKRGLWADKAPVPPWEWRATEKDRKRKPAPAGR
jgi:phosphatidylserine/phosphatidylglycerophosphate/cardiolipin synthase-like enzyme